MTHNFSLAVPYASVAAAGTGIVELKTPATGSIKLKATAHTSGSKIKVELIEAPTLTTGTTAVVPTNCDRTSSALSAALIKSNPTSISGGTTIDTSFSYELDPTEYILKANTTYIVRATNMDDSAANLTVLIDYAEIDVIYEYTVTFTVKDELDAVIEGAYVYCAGQVKYTTDAGTATFTLTPYGSPYPYYVSANYTEGEGEDQVTIPYIGVTGEVAVTNADVAVDITMVKYVAPTTATYSFRVWDDENNPVEGAIVTLGANDPATTDEDGWVTFEEQTPAEGVAYSIIADGLTKAEGTVDIVIPEAASYIYMEIPRYSVTFTVTNDSEPVSYARVDFLGYTHRTDSDGTLTVTGLKAGEYAYTIMYNGGYHIPGSLTVSNEDVSQAVEFTNWHAPVVAHAITDVPDAITGTEVTKDLSNVFSDADGNTLTLTADKGTITGSTWTYTPLADETVTVKITASDGIFSVEDSFTVTSTTQTQD